MADTKLGDAADSAKTEAGTEKSGGDTVDGLYTRPDLYRYQMNFPRVGICLIINNVNFRYYDMKDLSGCDYDADRVRHTFADMGYDIRMFRNLTTGEMQRALERVSEEDHSQNASFVCVILSHGSKDMIYGTNGPVKLIALTKYFKGNKCRSLLGKPKLFFINACRGEMADEGADVVDSVMEPITYRIPLEADFLYAYSTTDGYKAWMQERGSGFIFVVCEMIQNHRDLDLMRIMTRVNGKMARDFALWVTECAPPGMEVLVKQMPSVTSMLTKEFYFPNRFRF